MPPEQYGAIETDRLATPETVTKALMAGAALAPPFTWKSR